MYSWALMVYTYLRIQYTCSDFRVFTHYLKVWWQSKFLGTFLFNTVSTLNNKQKTTITHTHTHAHTHTRPFNSPLSGTTRVSRYQKGKTNLDFTEARDVSGSGISWAMCKCAPRSRQITTPAPRHSDFYRPDALPAAQPTASKHWRG